MGLDNFSVNEDDKSFFRDAANAIYEFLPLDKRIKLNLEFMSEGFSDIKELGEKERFFRLLHFLEVNYIRVVDWAGGTIERLRRIDEAQKKSSIKDIEIELFGKEKTSLYKIYKELSDRKIKDLFNSTISSLELEQEYKRYVINIKEVGKHE